MRRGPTTTPPPFRWSRLVAATAAGAAALAGLGVGFVQLPLTLTAPASGTSSISLLDDDGGAALFSAAGLNPGRVDTACVGLTADGSMDPDTVVGLSADVRSSALAPYLVVSVERGSVPAGGGCAAFSGEQIWSGTLAQVPGADSAGIPTGWRPALAPRSVYRFTVGVVDDPRAQGLEAAATFRWSLTEALPEPTPEPVPEPTAARSPEPPVEPTAEPAPEPVPQAAPSPAATAAPGRTAGPAVAAPAGEVTAPATPTTDAGAAPAPAAPPATAAAGGAPDVVEAPALEAAPAGVVQAVAEAVAQVVAQVASQVGQTAVAIADDGQFPVALVAVVGAFLFLQGRLDRRDPKLALARVREELSEYRDFPEPPTTETT